MVYRRPDTANLPARHASIPLLAQCQRLSAAKQVALSVGNHLADLPELTHAVKFAAVADSSREGLTDAWKQWIQAAGARCLLRAHVAAVLISVSRLRSASSP